MPAIQATQNDCGASNASEVHVEPIYLAVTIPILYFVGFVAFRTFWFDVLNMSAHGGTTACVSSGWIVPEPPPRKTIKFSPTVHPSAPRCVRRLAVEL